MRSLRRALVLAACICTARAGTSTGWHSARLAPFTVYAEGSAKEARDAVAQLEQLRFSLGELLGKKELTIRPALDVFLFASDSSGQGTDPQVKVTRKGEPALVLGRSGVSAEAKRLVAQMLLEQNSGRMAARLERGLGTFLSMAEVKGAHVVWGAPPAAKDRDFDWALVDWLATSPDTYGKFRVLLANLGSGVAENVAYRNSIGMTPEWATEEVNAFLKRGSFPTIDAPSRPLNAERDIVIRQPDADDMNLHLADLLGANAEQRYRDMLNAGHHKVAAEEGLGLLALRAGQEDKAREYFQAATRDGSGNAYMLAKYASVMPDETQARTLLEKAIAADPKSAEAHYLLAQRVPEPGQQIEQLRAAATLAPRNEDYWVALAQRLQTNKQWAEAAKAWSQAEQAATSPETREKMLQARLAIESQRLDDEEQKRRAEAEARQREIDRLRAEGWEKIHAAEAKASEPDGKDLAAQAVKWEDVHPAAEHVEGSLLRVDCANGRLRFLTVRTAGGKTLKLAVRTQDASELKLACGTAGERSVSLDYVAKANAKTGSAGDVSAIVVR